MIRINLQYIFALASRLDAMESVTLPGSRKIGDFVQQIYAVQQLLIEVYGNSSLYSPHLRHSSPQANRLYDLLKSATDAYATDNNAPISQPEQIKIDNLYREFRIVFESDLAAVNAFLVSRREPFDLFTILERGQAMFPASMPDKVPETVVDAIEAGRALAFELPTACGFHIFRVTESVIKRYWDKESGGKKRPTLQTIGNYAAEMEKAGFGDKKVIESLRQLAELHRNPIAHPEYILTLEEAIDTLGIARSVVAAMLTVLPPVPPTTSSPPVAQAIPAA